MSSSRNRFTRVRGRSTPFSRTSAGVAGWLAGMGLLMSAAPASAEEVELAEPDHVRVVQVVPFRVDKVIHQVIDLRSEAVRQAAGGCGPTQSTYSSLDFDSAVTYDQVNVVSLAQTEAAAAAYVLPASLFPIELSQVDIVFAQSATVQTTTVLSLQVWRGTPGTGQPIATIPVEVVIPADGNVATLVSVMLNQPVTDNGSHTFSVGFRIDAHNNQTQPNPCTSDPPAASNAFPTLDKTGTSAPTGNWVYYFNCGPFGCPAGWRAFNNVGGCVLNGDWNIRAIWTPQTCPPTGACCLPDGTCQSDIFDFECSAMGGVFQGDGLSCLEVDCSPKGACCIQTFCFDDVNELGCGNAGGTWQGEDSVCTSQLCATPIGACCLPSGGCLNSTTEDDCQASGGQYKGDGTTCANVQCTGACCFGTTCFANTLAANCSGAGGTWRGPGSTCAPNPCGQPATGACCAPDDTCSESVTQSNCTAGGGSWQGPNSICTPSLCTGIPDPTGACCNAGPNNCSCLPNRTQQQCDDAGGIFAGPQTTCAQDCESCAACCSPVTGGCVDLPPSDCENFGADPQSPGTSCSTLICEPPMGACCPPDPDQGECLLLEQADCSILGGTWIANTSCVEAACGSIGACCSAGGACAETEAAACAGMFQGVGTNCDGDPCSAKGCQSGADCDDNDACNGIETCNAQSQCVDGIPLDCNDGIACTIDDCDILLGCTHANMECDDGQFCNGAESCVNGNCQAGTPPCTTGTCNEGTDMCEGEAPGACCVAPGAVCTPQLTLAECTAEGGTFEGSGTTCDPNPCPCTVNVECDDGDMCNGLETCNMVSGSCVPGAPLNCDEGDICTQDPCDPATGCAPHIPVDCNDNDACTDDACDSLNGCIHTPIPCNDDGLFCNGAESCDPGLGCAGAAPCPATGSCNETTDACCPWDIATPHNSIINAADLAQVLANWGVAGGFGPADFNQNGVVNAADLAALLGNWGACP